MQRLEFQASELSQGVAYAAAAAATAAVSAATAAAENAAALTTGADAASVSSASFGLEPPPSFLGPATVVKDKDTGNGMPAAPTVSSTTMPTTLSSSSSSSSSSSTSSSSSSSSSASTYFSSFAAPSASVASLDVQRQLLRQAKVELEEARQRLQRARGDEGELTKQFEFEQSKREYVVEWMTGMQMVIWPSNAEEAQFGSPLGMVLVSTSAAAVTHGRVDVEAVFYEVSNHLKGPLLPDFLQEASNAALTLNIDRVEDVVYVIEAFKYMSWCNLCLQAMRMPMSTNVMRKLGEAARPLRLAEERIVKFFAQNLVRATQWKAKARRTIYGQQRRIESAKLSSLLLEGNAIPFYSRLKDMCRTSLELAASRVKGGHQSSSASQQALALAASAVPSSLSDEYSSFEEPLLLPLLPQFTVLSAEPPNSSDEEKVQVAGGTGTSYLPLHVLAPAPLDFWPPRLGFGPLRAGSVLGAPSQAIASSSSSSSSSTSSSSSSSLHIASIGQDDENGKRPLPLPDAANAYSEPDIKRLKN